MKAGSNFEKVLAAGHFAVTGELGPPQSNNIEVVKKKAGFLKGNIDAVNITDNQTSIVKMSSIAAAAICIQQGLEPVFQMTCRDRNRIAMQSDIFGASALGCLNMLCLSGDHPNFGNQKTSKKVFDIDSIQLIALAKRLRDERKLLDQEKQFNSELKLFIGGAGNPFSRPFEFRALRLAKKVMAGADFVQTQCVYDMERFRDWMKAVRDLGLHEKCYILAGVAPLRSADMAAYMAANVPGIVIPDGIMKRMNSVPKDKAGEEGIKISIELIEEIRQVEGIKGIHLMAIEWEHRAGEIIERAGLLPRPKVE